MNQQQNQSFSNLISKLEKKCESLKKWRQNQNISKESNNNKMNQQQNQPYSKYSTLNISQILQSVNTPTKNFNSERKKDQSNRLSMNPSFKEIKNTKKLLCLYYQ